MSIVFFELAFLTGGEPEMRLGLDAGDFEFYEVRQQRVAAEEHSAPQLQRGNPSVPYGVAQYADATAGERSGFVEIHDLRRIAADALGTVGINLVDAGLGSADGPSDKQGFGWVYIHAGHLAAFYRSPDGTPTH